MDAFQSDPAPAETREGPAIEPKIQDLLDSGRIKNRYHRIHHCKFTLMTGGRGFTSMVISHQGQHSAPCRSSCQVGMTQCISRTVDARPFTIPEAENSIVTSLPMELGLLGSPNRRCRQVFIDPGVETDMVFFQQLPVEDQLLIECSQRRSPVAADKASGVPTL